MQKSKDLIAAIYSRKSKFSEKGESIENQIQLCREYCNSHGIKIYDEYEDEGRTGANLLRPEFQRLSKDAKNKEFNVLICYRLDRISRNVLDFSNTIEDLNKLNISFISIREQFDTTTPMGRAMMYIASVFAQLERETIAERIKDNMIELSKTGRWLGGTPPLGFRSEPIEYHNEDGKSKKMYKLSSIPEEIPIIERIYQLYIEKRSFTPVASLLCKNEYKGKNGGEFSRETVKQIINNPVYCIADENSINWFRKKGAAICVEPGDADGVHGLMVYNKRENGKKEKPINEWIIAVGKHQGVIPSEKWLKCQEVIEQNKVKVSPRSGTGDKFLLSGMMVCGECSSGMASWSHKNTRRDFMERYYRCNLKNRAANRCGNTMLNAYKAEEYVSEYLLNLDINELLKVHSRNKNNQSQRNEVKDNIISLSKTLEDNEKIIKGLIRRIGLLGDGDKLIKDYESEIEALKMENNIITDSINELKGTLKTVEDQEELLEDLETKLNHFKQFFNSVDTESKRILIKDLVESIVWYGDMETIEINLIGSNKKLPNGKVKRRI